MGRKGVSKRKPAKVKTGPVSSPSLRENAAAPGKMSAMQPLQSAESGRTPFSGKGGSKKGGKNR